MSCIEDCELETERLINFLFPEGISEDYAKNPDFITYVNKLGTYKVDQLYKEKINLAEEKSLIDNQTKNLALNNYKSFIQTAECSHSIRNQVYALNSNVDSISEEIPKLLLECEKFTNTSVEIQERRKRNNLILSNNVEILQILEIPQFMNNCIRNDRFEEALSLAAYVKRLSNKYDSIPFISQISVDVDKCWCDLANRLVQHLRHDISLPKCLQIVGYLRRMSIFSEIELRLKFLQARNAWLKSALQDIPTENREQHLSSVIDVTRVDVFSIVTQYKAVFTKDESVYGENYINNSIFYSWLNKVINDFVATVRIDLPYCPSSSLDSLLGQSMYFGQSFGRIGADFRGLIIMSFVETVERNFETAIKKADKQFELNMDKYTLPKTDDASSIISSLKTETDTNQQINPPVQLLEFYPLAAYCNALVLAFNGLRYCAPIGVITTVSRTLQTSLKHVSSVLLAYRNREFETWLEPERNQYANMYASYDTYLVPFVNHSLDLLFDRGKTANQLGVSTSYLETEGIGNLQTSSVLEPLPSG